VAVIEEHAARFPTAECDQNPTLMKETLKQALDLSNVIKTVDNLSSLEHRSRCLVH